MKKILITMIAIAFSLSAFSDISEIDRGKELTAWCVNGHVFISTLDGGLVQMMTEQGANRFLIPMRCLEYMAVM